MINQDDLMMREFIKKIIELHQEGHSVNQIVLITQGIYPNEEKVNLTLDECDQKYEETREILHLR